MITKNNKLAYLCWSWGFLLLVEVLLGEIFVTNSKNQLLQIIGLILLIFGLVLVPLPFFIFPKKGKVPEGKKFIETTVIIDSGIYGMVRHPQYLGWALIASSLVLLRQHEIILLVGIITIILVYFSVLEEEKSLIRKFSTEYEIYMKKVPRWNLFLGVLRYYSIFNSYNH